MAHPPSTTEPHRREPTAAEARALGHPLRMRILFACRHRAQTNKELAEDLGTTPGTIHYHLKQLVAQDFLRLEEPRPGPRGSTEQPYRATGKSWQLAESHPGGVSRTLLQVGVDELLDARDEDVLALTRLGLSLPEEDRGELVRRIGELVEEFADRSRTSPGGPLASSPDDGSEAMTLFVALHRTHPRGEA